MSLETIPTEVPNTVTPKLPTYDALALTQQGTQAQIVLGDQVYFLRVTRAGKLILTK